MIPNESSLPSLASQISALHEECQQHYKRSLSIALKIGSLLLEAKSMVRHGEWLVWLGANCELSERTAQVYMQVAKKGATLEQIESADSADLTIESALNQFSSHNSLVTITRPKAITSLGKPQDLEHRYSIGNCFKPGDRVRITDKDVPEYGMEIVVSEIVQDAIAITKDDSGQEYPLLVNQIEPVNQVTIPHSPVTSSRPSAARSLGKPQDLQPSSSIPMRELRIANCLRRILADYSHHLPQELVDEARELLH